MTLRISFQLSSSLKRKCFSLRCSCFPPTDTRQTDRSGSLLHRRSFPLRCWADENHRILWRMHAREQSGTGTLHACLLHVQGTKTDAEVSWLQSSCNKIRFGWRSPLPSSPYMTLTLMGLTSSPPTGAPDQRQIGSGWPMCPRHLPHIRHAKHPECVPDSWIKSNQPMRVQGER